MDTTAIVRSVKKEAWVEQVPAYSILYCYKSSYFYFRTTELKDDRMENYGAYIGVISK